MLGLAVAAAGARFGLDGHVAGWPVRRSLMAHCGKRGCDGGLGRDYLDTLHRVTSKRGAGEWAVEQVSETGMLVEDMASGISPGCGAGRQ